MDLEKLKADEQCVKCGAFTPHIRCGGVRMSVLGADSVIAASVGRLAVEEE